MHRRTDFQIALRGRRAGSRTLVAHSAVPARPDLVPEAGPVRALGATLPRSGAQPSPHDADEAALVGFVVSRAVGGAVVRKRVQRQLRHLVLPYLPGLPAGTRVVVRALPAAATASSVVLRSDLDAVILRLLRHPTPHPARPPRTHDVPLLP